MLRIKRKGSNRKDENIHMLMLCLILTYSETGCFYVLFKQIYRNTVALHLSISQAPVSHDPLSSFVLSSLS